MSEPLTVLVAGQQSDDDRTLIRAAAGGAEVIFVPRVGDAADAMARVTAVAGSVTASQLSSATELRWVHSWAAGADTELYAEMVASPVVLTSSVGNGAIPLAEHSMMLMLMLNRDAPRWASAQSAKRWDRFTHGELNGLTVGIYGLGNSGADLAAKAHAFHMRVLGLRRRPNLSVPAVDRMFGPDDLHEFLGECDFVVVTAPLTADTRGVFDERAFRAMRSSAFFVCISRGGIADDRALLTALEEGWIAGAGLDAHGTEPLPSESPFWELPHVIVTPHNGATTAATARRGVDIFVDNLRRFTTGAPLRNVVDKSAGY